MPESSQENLPRARKPLLLLQQMLLHRYDHLLFAEHTAFLTHRGARFRGNGGLRISLFITCYNDTLFPETGKAAVVVLERLGRTVDFRLDQTCCVKMITTQASERSRCPLMKQFFAYSRILG